MSWNNKQRRQMEKIERDKRTEILHKIKGEALRRRSKHIKTFSKVGYVLGRYDPNTCSYEYRYATGFTSLLTSALIMDKAENLPSLDTIREDDKVKGCKYSVSKVFYKIISTDIKENYIEKVTLTKPNHYELLCAVVNNI